MGIDFSALKNRKQSSAARFETIKSEATKTNSFEKKEDTRFWRPEVDKAGNAYAVIRFLDAPNGEDTPWVRIWDHGFKNPANGKWYIEKSLTTLGQPDPLGELNSKLWATNTEANKEIVRRQKRKLSYFANILVVTDSKHPENEGKVFLFRFGKKIFDKIKDKMSPPPEFEDETPLDPFNFWEGANFKLKQRKVEGYPNYDKSEFEGPTAIGDDDKIKEVWESCYSLQELVDPKHFKSYDELKRNLETVLNGAASTKKAEDVDTEGTDVETIDYGTQAAAPAKAAKAAKAPKAESKPAETAESEDDMSFFTKLADDDAEGPF